MINISITSPGARAQGRELYHRVRITPNGSRLRYEYSYLEAAGEDGRQLVCTETGITQLFDDPREVLGADATAAAEVTPPVVRDFLGQWERLEQAARLNLESFLGGGFTRSVRTRRELSDEFLADVVRRHRQFGARGVAPTEALAREEGVGSSTVRNWLRKAREAGIED
jgi:hypothetical protein